MRCTETTIRRQVAFGERLRRASLEQCIYHETLVYVSMYYMMHN
jgi:hypothetical protein